MSIKNEVIVWASIAGLGGAARFLVERLSASALPLSTGRLMFLLLANVFVSGFSGIMGGLVMTAVTAEPEFVLAGAGIFGYLGPAGLDILTQKISKKLQ